VFVCPQGKVLRRVRLRGLLGAQDEFLLAATAQNLGTLVRHVAAPV